MNTDMKRVLIYVAAKVVVNVVVTTVVVTAAVVISRKLDKQSAEQTAVSE